MTEKNHFDGANYVTNFNAASTELPGSSVAWLNDLRQSSMTAFENVGLPGPKVEEWKYSNLNILKSGQYQFLNESSSQDLQIDNLCDKEFLKDIKGAKVVFCNGYYHQSLSNISAEPGITLVNLNEYIKVGPKDAQRLIHQKKSKSSLNALNAALMSDGVVLIVEQDVKLSEPIQIIHINTEMATAKALRNRHYIQIEKNASAQIIESYIGVDGVDCWSHTVSEINVADGASLEIYQFQNEGNATIHTNEAIIDLGEGTTFKHCSLNIGGRLSRTEIKPTLKGINSKIELRGAFLSRDGNSHDVFTHIKHMVEQCDSEQNYRGVLAKGGKSAFQGKVYVAKDAQLTNANQSNKNLILERGAEANSKPELLIYADDVKCSHGATVGELDQEALFYLKTRGLDQAAAKALLVEAFIAEVYEDVVLEPVKCKYLDLARKWLEAEL